jgi:predicted membrane-bound spermidine synthase
VKIHRTTLLLIVFTSGMAALAVELSASRLLDPYFGNSLIIWANLIGLVLIYLTVGYYLGGRLADRYPQESLLYQITAWAGFAIGLIPTLARPILAWSVQGFARYDAGILLGSLLGVILLFSVPVTLLGCVSPFAIRLAVGAVSNREGVRSTGSVAGSIYALSTIGSIVGTFAPVLLLIPNIGTRATFLLLSLTLLVASLVGLASVRPRRAGLYLLLLVIIGALALFGSSGAIKDSPGMVYEAESAYNYIQVVRYGDDVYLKLNEGQGVHSIYNPYEILTGGVWDYFLVAPYFNNPPYTEERVRSMALLGSAAGTIAREYTAAYGPIPIDGAEIDPEIIRLGREFFAMNEPNFHPVAQDARYFLATSVKKWDVVGIDAYRPPYIPFHLTSREFFQEVHEHLTDKGVVAINAGRTADDYSLVSVLASTMKAVFPNVYVIDVPDEGSTLGNSLVVATVQPTRLKNFAANTAMLRNPLLKVTAQNSLGYIREYTATGPVFTDDRAPVEQVIHGLILRYVVSGH